MSRFYKSGLVVAGVGISVAVIAFWYQPRRAAGQGSWIYNVETQSHSAGNLYTVNVEPAIWDNNFGAYKMENDQRIDEWVGNPGGAPIVDGKPVKVTFVTPQSYADAMAIVGPYAASFRRHSVVGTVSTNGEDRIKEGEGPLNAGDVGIIQDPLCGIAVDPNGVADPAYCGTVSFSGFLEVEFMLQGGLPALDALSSEDDVFLADSTGIAVLELLAPQGITMANIQGLTLPWVMYDSSVTWP